MNVQITEYLKVDLSTERWQCAKCNHELGDARKNYKEFLLIHDRNPREVHQPMLDPERYEFCFAPDPNVCVIYEFYCPCCGVMMDVEYTIPGHAPLHDMEIDIDSLREKWSDVSSATPASALFEKGREAL